MAELGGRRPPAVEAVYDRLIRRFTAFALEYPPMRTTPSQVPSPVLFILAFLAASAARSETLELRSSADTTLHELFPTNNLGAFPFINAGTTAKDTATRSLVRFDLSAVPTNARITSARVDVDLLFGAPLDLAPEILFGLHRVEASWGEGTRGVSNGNIGSPAGEGEASWLFSQRPERWASPGGDFASAPSAMVAMLFPKVYTFESAGLVKDVQRWLRAPQENHGWVLKSGEEDAVQSAKRFASRESSGGGAVLRLDYSLGPEPLTITAIKVQGATVRVEWRGGTAPYRVQTSSRIDGGWTNAGAASPGFAAELPIAGGSRFFRVAGN